MTISVRCARIVSLRPIYTSLVLVNEALRRMKFFAGSSLIVSLGSIDHSRFDQSSPEKDVIHERQQLLKSGGDMDPLTQTLLCEKHKVNGTASKK